MSAIRKGVIPAAGWGTRFLPVTKALPKEMLPIIDRPALQYIVEEAVQAGLQHLTIVTSRLKESMANYFDKLPELDQLLEAKGDVQRLEEVRRLSTMVDLAYVRQQEQLGLGHAVLTARNAVGNEPFAVFLPDDIMVCDGPAIAQLLEMFQRYEGSVVGLEEIPPEATQSYGVVDVEPLEEGVYKVKGLVEKPEPADAPSNLGIVGRYVFTPGIFQALAEVQPGALGELQLTDGMNLLAHREPMYARVLKGKRYDVGSPFGMLKASVELALQREDIGPQVREWLKGLEV